MKLFSVQYEEDGLTTKEPGLVTTNIRVVTMHFAAESMEQVWAEIEYLRTDEEKNVVSIQEALPMDLVDGAAGDIAAGGYAVGVKEVFLGIKGDQAKALQEFHGVGGFAFADV